MIIDCLPGEDEATAEARVKATPKKPKAKTAPSAGVFPNMLREEYDRLDRHNWSKLKAMGRSPAHYRHLLKNERKDTEGFKRGRVGHLAVLEPDKFHRDLAIWGGGRRQGKEWQQFVEENAGREIVSNEDWVRAADMARAVRADASAARYLESGHAEVSVLWNLSMPTIGACPGYSFACKGRLDFLSGAGAIVDLKTTRDASPDGFGREVWRLRYDAQAAFYVDGYEAATGKRLPYVLIAVEPEAPHVVQVYRVPEEILELGREHYRALLDRLSLCKREGKWTGYAEGEMDLTLPRWAVPFTDGDDVSDLDLVIGE